MVGSPLPRGTRPEIFLKKRVDKLYKVCYIIYRKGKEIKEMTKQEIIDYLYEINVHADITIEELAEDLAKDCEECKERK